MATGPSRPSPGNIVAPCPAARSLSATSGPRSSGANTRTVTRPRRSPRTTTTPRAVPIPTPVAKASPRSSVRSARTIPAAEIHAADSPKAARDAARVRPRTMKVVRKTPSMTSVTRSSAICTAVMSAADAEDGRTMMRTPTVVAASANTRRTPGPRRHHGARTLGSAAVAAGSEGRRSRRLPRRTDTSFAHGRETGDGSRRSLASRRRRRIRQR